MTRDMIIECLVKDDGTISCNDVCDIELMEFYNEPWDAICIRCAEKQLAEYEQKIREDARKQAIDEFIDDVLNGYTFTELNREALEFMLEDARKEMLKEQKK